MKFTGIIVRVKLKTAIQAATEGGKAPGAKLFPDSNSETP